MMATFIRGAVAAVLAVVSPAVAVSSAAGPAGCAAGQIFVAGDITVGGAFSRATPPNAPVGAGYLTIVNNGAAADRLVGVGSVVAASVEVHTAIMENDVMRMVPLVEGLEVPAGGVVDLAPGGPHVMFIGPFEPFREGDCLALTLSFETAGTLMVQLPVGPIGVRAAPRP